MHTPSKHGARSTDESPSSLFSESVLTAAFDVESCRRVRTPLLTADDGEKAQTAQDWAQNVRAAAATEGNLILRSSEILILQDAVRSGFCEPEQARDKRQVGCVAWCVCCATGSSASGGIRARNSGSAPAIGISSSRRRHRFFLGCHPFLLRPNNSQ